MTKKIRNLNTFKMETDGNFEDQLIDNSIVDGKRTIRVFFRDIEKHLIAEIEKADIVLGCIAWVTHPDILEALSKRKGVSIIVQKEDLGRPDTGVTKSGWNKWKANLRKKYDSINCGLDRFMFDNVLSKVSICSDPTIKAVRCVGNKRGKTICPLMHNKFLVFARLKRVSEDVGTPLQDLALKLEPYAVWTGSFNFTKNAVCSLENAVLIKDKTIVNAYYREYGQICAMSEPLDWTSDRVAPEWRIGT